jgi:DNA-binding CsgD family transcriptional regulator
LVLMRLLERDREGAAVRALVDRAVAGSGGLLVIEGPSGIGKSALVAQLAGSAVVAGVAVRSARGTRLGGEIPFALARWLLEPAVAAAPSVLAVGWARHARPLFEGEISGAGDQRSLVEGLVALVAELRRGSGPLAVIVDDAHWGDPASLEFLDELAARCEDIGVVVAVAIGTGQGGVDGPSLQRLAAAAGTGMLAPAPLSEGAVRELICERLPNAGEAFAARVVQAASGNPLLVAELIDSAERHGTERLRIPKALSRIVLLRLEDAGPQARALAEAVAVLGEAPLRLAAALAGLDRRVADNAADELVARHVLVAGERVRFAQPLVGEALGATIAPFELAARHGRAAQLLADDGAQPDQIASHLLHTRPCGEGWVCGELRQAARTAVGRGDPSVAAQLLGRAFAEPPPAADRGALLLELASARAAAGQPEAIETFERALANVSNPRQRAEAWLGLSRLLYARGEFAGAATAGARGNAELPDGDPLAERLMAAELTAASSAPELAADAIKRLDALVGGAPPADPTLLAMLISHQAARVVEIERVPEFARRAVAADPLIDPESHGIPLLYVAGALNWVDESVLAEQMLDRGLKRAMKLGDPLAEINVRSVRAWCRIFRGRLNLAAEDLDAILAAGELGWRSIDAVCAMPLIVLRLELGDLDAARDALRRAPPGTQISLPWYEGAVALAAGDPAAALSAFEAAGAELEDALGMVNPGVRPWRSSAALAAAQLGKLERARALAALEVQQARAANGARALGIALRAAGLVGEDPTLLEESVAVLEHSPARLELGRSLMFAGIAQRRAGRTTRARLTLSRALELAMECGARPLVERTLTELRAAGARPRRRPRAGLGALTASERQTAELAAAGRTTKQIAATLFLSPKTVEGHLTSVFRKLGVASRSELGSRLASRGAEEPMGR